MITRSDTVASPLRQGEEAPTSGFAWRKPQESPEPRQLQPYTARLTEPELLLPTSDDPTVVDQGLARMSVPPRPPEDRISVTPSRMSVTPSRMSLTPSRMSMTPSRVLEPTVSLAAPRVPAERVSSQAPHQDPSAAVPPTGRARGVDYGPWLLVLGTTLAAAMIGAVLGYVTRPNVAPPAPRPAATARVTPRVTAEPQVTSRAQPSAPTTPAVRTESPVATSSVPVMRLGELPVDATAAPEPSTEPAPSAAPLPTPARRAPAPRPAPRLR